MSESMFVRLTKQIRLVGDCWVWCGNTNNWGYGQINVKVGKIWHKRLAHRVAYEHFVGSIPAGLTIDHLCNNPACINPEHLEAVVIGENSRRSPNTLNGMNARKTHCPRGHPYLGANLYIENGKRRCRACSRLKAKKQYERIKSGRE